MEVRLSTQQEAVLAEIAAVEGRSTGELVREAIDRFTADKERRRAAELGLLDDDQPMTDAYRRTVGEKIAQGLDSARQGRFVDGAAVFARIEAELVELERQGAR